MGIFTSKLETKIHFVSYIATDAELDGIILEIIIQEVDGGFYIGEPTIEKVTLDIGDEIIL
jgi:hypothetical protein